MAPAADPGDGDSAEKKDDSQAQQANDLVKGFAFEQLHSDEGFSVVLFDGVNGADAGVVQRGGGTSFAEKTLMAFRILQFVFGKEFQRDAASKS